MANPVVREILRQGRSQKRKHVLSALATGKVESGFRNLNYGDADSKGWRQERASIYRNPTNLRASVHRFYHEANQLDRGQSAGELAADVQRPAAQYRGRYAQVLPQVKGLLRGGGGGRSQPVARTGRARLSSVQLGRKTTVDQAGFDQANRRAMLAQFLQRSGRGNSILFRSGLLSTTAPSQGDFTTSTLTSKIVGGGASGVAGGGNSGAGGVTYGNLPGNVNLAVRAAKNRLGTSEVGGNNRGPKVDKWERKYGMVGQPWCGIFVGTVLQRAGVKGITSRVASVAAIEQDAQAGRNGFSSWHSARNARKGDAVTFASHSHVGFVTKVDRRRGIVYTIEGNTGTGNVARRQHSFSEIKGAARPNYG
jgi:hypothetical protein